MSVAPEHRDAPLPGRPRLLFVRPTTEHLPSYIVTHFTEQERCLALHFDVTVAPPDGDYRRYCETLQPDLVLVESGVYTKDARTITNTDAFPEIPKLGFLNADAYCPTRSVFLADMERWGIDTFFTHSVSMAGYTPAIAERLFVWPNSIDPSVYRDHGGPKLIPVLSAGSRAPHYPWRNQVLDRIARRYPTLSTPHFGWFDGAKTTGMVHGADYARLISAASFAPTCGTVANEVVRKHFEVPGCRTCLVTERTPALIDAGFVDMENCVFVEVDDVLDKLEFLFANPELLQAITDRGHALAHARHTWRNRDQIAQWLALHRRARPGQRIVQTGPFGPLVLADAASGAGNRHVDPQGRDRALLEQAQRLYAERQYLAAERLFQQCANYHPSTPEPYLGLARTALRRGDARAALEHLEWVLDFSLRVHKADSPDPVEWAYVLVALLCLGRPDEAAARAARYPRLNHPHLAWARRAVAALAPGRAPAVEPQGPVRPSIHAATAGDEAAWFAELGDFLQRCGQAAMAKALRRVRAGAGPVEPGAGPPADRAAASASPGPRRRIAEKLRRHAIRTLADFDYPRRFVADRGAPNPLAAEVGRLAASGEIRSVLLVAEHSWSPASYALFAAMRANPSAPTLLRLAAESGLPLEEAAWDGGGAPAALPVESLGRILDARALGEFDLVLIDGAAPRGFEDEAVLTQAKVVLVDRLDAETNRRIARRLSLAEPDYQLAAGDLNGGFAVFRRMALGSPAARRTKRRALAE